MTFINYANLTSLNPCLKYQDRPEHGGQTGPKWSTSFNHSNQDRLPAWNQDHQWVGQLINHLD